MERTKKLFSLVLVIAFCVCIGLVSSSEAITVNVTDDGYRFEHPGGSGWVWYSTYSKSYNQHGGFDAYGVMKFDIEGALAGYTSDDIISADLKFYVTDKQGAGPDPYPVGTDAALNIKVYSMDEPQWSEGAGDGDMPQFYMDPLEINQSHTTGYDVWVSVDFTQIVKVWLAFGAEYANGIEIWEGVPNDDLGLYWNSREAAASEMPYLEVNVVPEPTIVALLGLGCLALLRRRRA